MMGASMKDWDKESEEEGGEGHQEGVQKGSVEYNSESDWPLTRMCSYVDI